MGDNGNNGNNDEALSAVIRKNRAHAIARLTPASQYRYRDARALITNWPLQEMPENSGDNPRHFRRFEVSMRVGIWARKFFADLAVITCAICATIRIA